MKCIAHLLFISIIAGLFSLQVQAHGRFILPSHTMLSAEQAAYATMLASISNDVFHPDMPFANSAKGIKVNPKLTKVFSMLDAFVVTPDQQKQTMDYQAFQRFSVADLKLSQKGTHGVFIEQKPFVVTTFNHANGENGRVFGPGKDLPKNVTNVSRRNLLMRSGTYVSFNGLSDIKLQGTGLEISGHHPNDLFTGETARFQLRFNGEPLTQATEVALIKEDTRHRNQREIQTINTSTDGRFEVTFKQAGFYLLETQVSKPSQQAGIDIEQATLYLTLEVFPE